MQETTLSNDVRSLVPPLPPISPKVIEYPWQNEAADNIVRKLTIPDEKIINGYKEVIENTVLGGVIIDQQTRRENVRKIEVGITKNCVLLRAGTGTGKMYMVCLAIRKLYEQGALVSPPGSVNPFKVLWLTPKSVKAQTQRTIYLYGLTKLVHVMSYSELKTSMGAMYITWIEDHVLGSKIPIWNLNILPALVKCDECQVLKNPESIQSQVVRAIPFTVKSILASATPFQRVIDAQTMLERSAAITQYNTLPATKETSKRILDYIASPKGINEYSPSAVDRLRGALSEYIVELKNVRFKHKATTKCVDIYFKSADERLAYEKLVAELIENLRRRKGEDGTLSYIHFLVEMQKMQQGAELLRCPHIVERVLTNLPTKAIVIASNFVDTLLTVNKLLLAAGISENRIAIVMGGQDMEARQRMVDDFQRGTRDILLFTMRSGGVGISLHHDRETTKPRHIILPPTWSAIDLVQALGRVHRITTISDTTQEILWYAETIETAVKQRVELKINCLAKAITAKEQFVDTFAEKIGERIDGEELAEEMERESHANDDESLDKDDTDSKDEQDSITGEGLENERE